MNSPSGQIRTVIRLVERTEGMHELRWGRLHLPERVDPGLVRRVGRFHNRSELGSVVLSRPLLGYPRGTTLVRGRTFSGSTAVVAIYEAA